MCPPGVDQTTRSAQQWQIIAPRARKTVHVIPPEWSFPPSATARDHLWIGRREFSSGCFLFSDQLYLDMWSKLVRRDPQDPAPMGSQTPALTARCTKPLSTLESLPPELLQVIADDPGLAEADVIALGLAAPTLWPYALRRVDAAAAATTAPLADTELACTGTYLTTVPPSFIEAGLAPGPAEEAEWKARRWGPCPARKFNWRALSTWEKLEPAPTEPWAAAWATHVRSAVDLPPRVAAALAAELAAHAQGLCGVGPEQAFVLRNLDARQYVRCRTLAASSPLDGEGPRNDNSGSSEAIDDGSDGSETGDDGGGSETRAVPQRRGFVDHPAAAGLRLDDVFVLRTVWSSTRPAWERVEDDQRADGGGRCGAWAGHRFDVVPWDDDTMGGAGMGWEDCTDEVVQDALRAADVMNAARGAERRKSTFLAARKAALETEEGKP